MLRMPEQKSKEANCHKAEKEEIDNAIKQIARMLANVGNEMQATRSKKTSKSKKVCYHNALKQKSK